MGEINITKTGTIDVGAERLWEILAGEFIDVGRWATGVSSSASNPKANRVPAGANTGGRVCDVPGFGVTDERFTMFDDDQRTFTYSVDAEKIPGFVTGVANTWKVNPQGDQKSLVTSNIVANASGVMGAIMGPMMKRKFATTVDQIFLDLKTYAETGAVSAAKKTALAKAK